MASLELHPAPTTDDVNADLIAERRRRLAVYREAAHDKEFRAYIYRRCEKDPIFWFENFAWTKEKRRTRTQRTTRIPFLLWDYHRNAIRWFLGLDGCRDPNDELYPVVLDASRELGKSKLPVLCMCWDWQFNEGADYGIVSRVQADVDNNKDHGDRSLFSFLRWAIRQQPVWMRPPPFKEKRRDRFDDCWLEVVNPVKKNSIVGASTVVDAMRGDRRKRVFVDEGNSIKELEELLDSLMDVGPPWIVSSVKGRTTGFARLVHGDTDIRVYEEGEQQDKYGWVHLRWHYSERPDRKPGTQDGDAWRARMIELLGETRFAQEHGIDYLVSVPGRIWAADYDDDYHSLSAEQNRWLVKNRINGMLIEGWDFGSSLSLTSVVWAVVIDGQLFVLDYRHWEEADLYRVIQEVGAAGYYCRENKQGVKPYHRVGDRASGSRAKMVGGKKFRKEKTWIQNLRDEGDIQIAGRGLEVTKAIQRVKTLLSADKLFFAPKCKVRRGKLPSLIECVQQYRMHIPDVSAVEYCGGDPVPAKDVYSHTADALQHVVWQAWPQLGMK